MTLYKQEIERGILGSCMLETKAFDIALDAGVTDSWFYVPENKRLWAELYKMHVGGEKIDLITVNAKYGDWGFLEGIIDENPTPAHSDYYVKEADELRKKRAVKEIVMKAEEDIAEEDSEKVISRTSVALMGVDSKTVERTASEHMADNLCVIQNAGNGIVSGIPLPFTHFSDLIGGLQRGSYIPVVGRDGKGKSGLLAQLLDFWAGEHIPTLAFCLEDVARRVTLRMGGNRKWYSAMDAETGFVKQGDARVKMTTSEVNNIYRQVDEYREWLVDKPFFVEETPTTVEEIVTTIRRYKRVHDIQVVTIDGFKDIHHSVGDSTTAKEKHITQQLCGIAKELNLCMPVVSHINKIEEDKLISKRDVTGSGEQSKGARQMLIFQDSGHPSIEDENRFLLSVAKGNFSGGGSILLDRDEKVLNYREI